MLLSVIPDGPQGRSGIQGDTEDLSFRTLDSGSASFARIPE
jgi:hypothetical protein